MTKPTHRHGAYAQKVVEQTQEYVQGLLSRNQELQERLLATESEIRGFKRDRERLEEQVAAVRRDLERSREEHQLLQRQLAEAREEQRSFSELHGEIQEQNNNLVNLYVASFRLHGSTDRQTVLEAIQEIVINLIGCEQFGVYERNGEEGRLSLVRSFGLEGDVELPLTSGPVDKVLQSAQPWITEESEDGKLVPGEHELTACIPLLVDDRVSGIIALFELLPQKSGRLGPLDYELFDLLACQAATALYLTGHRTAEAAPI